MKKIIYLRKIILMGILIPHLYSCRPPLYFPNGINAPLLSQKGEFTLNAATDGLSTDIQMSTSTSDNIGVLVNINFADYSGETTTSINSGSKSLSTSHPYAHSHSFYEAGAGIYSKIGNHGRTETFALIGFGSAESSGNGSGRTGNYMRFAVQSDIGIETNAFEGVLSCRMGYLDLNTHSNNEINGYSYDSYNNDPSSFFIDPAITLRFGWKGFKLFSQYGLSIPFNGATYDWSPDWWTFGLQMKL